MEVLPPGGSGETPRPLAVCNFGSSNSKLLTARTRAASVHPALSLGFGVGGSLLTGTGSCRRTAIPSSHLRRRGQRPRGFHGDCVVPEGMEGPRGPPVLSFEQAALPVPLVLGASEPGSGAAGGWTGQDCSLDQALDFASSPLPPTSAAIPTRPLSGGPDLCHCLIHPPTPPTSTPVSGKGQVTWLSPWATSWGLLPALFMQALSHCWAAGHSSSPKVPFPPTLAALTGRAPTLHPVDPLAGQAGKAGPGLWSHTSTLAETQQERRPPGSHQQERDVDGKNAVPPPPAPGKQTCASFLAAASMGGGESPQASEKDCQGTSHPAPRVGLLSNPCYPQAGTSTCEPVLTAPRGLGVPALKGCTRSPVLLAPGICWQD